MPNSIEAIISVAIPTNGMMLSMSINTAVTVMATAVPELIGCILNDYLISRRLG